MNETVISNPEQLAMFDHPGLIRRYADRSGIKLDEAAHRFNELKKFLYMCAVSDFPCVPSKQIDDIWHEFVLYTKDYQDFCAHFLGGFIHHNPTEQGDTEAYNLTREAAIKTFGSLDSNMWPQAKCNTADCDTSCNHHCSASCDARCGKCKA
jgi:hypothetical protein